MKLTELNPQFMRYDPRPDGIYLPRVDTIEQAQGIRFLCPVCFKTNGGRVGTHSVMCWSRSRGVSEEATPKGRWTLHGTGYHDLTLHGDPVGSARSVLLLGGCNWHGFVTEGEVT